MPYHFSHAWLDAGSILLPGNFGRVLSAAGFGHSNALAESVLEDVRIREFPNLPSRLQSAFYFDTLERAHTYRQHQSMRHVNLYEVERVANDAVEARVDFRRVSPMGALGYGWARSYWRGEAFANDVLNGVDSNLYVETLSVSALRIVRLVSQE